MATFDASDVARVYCPNTGIAHDTSTSAGYKKHCAGVKEIV